MAGIRASQTARRDRGCSRYGRAVSYGAWARDWAPKARFKTHDSRDWKGGAGRATLQQILRNGSKSRN